MPPEEKIRINWWNCSGLHPHAHRPPLVQSVSHFSSFLVWVDIACAISQLLYVKSGMKYPFLLWCSSSWVFLAIFDLKYPISLLFCHTVHQQGGYCQQNSPKLAQNLLNTIKPPSVVGTGGGRWTHWGEARVVIKQNGGCGRMGRDLPAICHPAGFDVCGPSCVPPESLSSASTLERVSSQRALKRLVWVVHGECAGGGWGCFHWSLTEWYWRSISESLIPLSLVVSQLERWLGHGGGGSCNGLG